MCECDRVILFNGKELRKENFWHLPESDLMYFFHRISVARCGDKHASRRVCVWVDGVQAAGELDAPRKSMNRGMPYGTKTG
jgi:hypothetical protein